MSLEILLWLIAFIALVIAEFATMQLISIWFAAGSFAAIIVAVFGLPFFMQAIAFIVVSTVLLAFTRPFLKKILHKTPIPTNAELDIGKTALVIENIDNIKMTGRVSLNGVDWTARSSSNNIINEGETVVIDKIEGSKIYVSAE